MNITDNNGNLNGEGQNKAMIDEMLLPQIQLPEISAMFTEEGYAAWGLGIAKRNTPFSILQQQGGNKATFNQLLS